MITVRVCQYDVVDNGGTIVIFVYVLYKPVAVLRVTPIYDVNKIFAVVTAISQRNRVPAAFFSGLDKVYF